MKYFSRISLLILTIILMVSSCSKKKNSFTRRSYHSTTSHYNYYFNASELLRVHLENIENSYIDDYNYILPIFFYGTEDQAKGAYADMEEIVKKCSKLIDRHSMYINNEEYNKWIDDSYILVGKAKFYRREFYGAIEIFEYVTYAFADEPSYFEAKIWLARTYLQMEDKRETEDILESMKENTLPAEHKGDYYALYADLSFKNGDLEMAAVHLKSAIDHVRDKKLKRRYTYILAQLYHEMKDYPNATLYYGKVLKMRPDYRMSFNAKLNQARSYDIEAGNSEEIVKRLNRMLRDKKNLEFRDQIYLALAEMAFREGNQEKGMDYLKKCAAASMGNNKVKSEAYMMLGDIYYDKPVYITSHAYYDSCLTVMPENHPKLENTKERKESLDDLVVNLLSIERQDSIQKISKMDEKERDKLIADIIKQIEREEELKNEEMANSLALGWELANKRTDESAQVGSWYFYNQSVKSFGVSDFKKKWGERPYEDNWRRSDKSSELKFTENVVDTVVEDSSMAGLTNKDAEFYLNQLPFSDSAMALSHNIIISALYNAGNIFREQFRDYRSAIECFERLVAQYDTCRYVESSYYQMYRIYLIMEEPEKADKYRNILLNDYPFSEYARIIKNPEYMKNKRDKKEQIEAYYGATYKLYSYELYEDVIDACSTADTMFGENHMKPKFDYLRALAIGKSRTRDEFRMALEEVVVNHPTDGVAKAAETTLLKMNEISENKDKREAIYKKNFRDDHICVIMVPNLSTTVDNIKTTISNYNINNIGAGKLNLTSVVFDNLQQMISVKSFNNKDDAMLYLNNLSQNPEFISGVIENNYDRFIISTENYAFFYQQKNLKEYISFYNDHYLNN